MERADEIFVFPVDFGWSDLGTWVSLHERMPQDINGNVSIAPTVELLDSHNCVVHAQEAKRVVLIGINDCVVSEHDGNILVCKMSEENRIREVADK